MVGGAMDKMIAGMLGITPDGMQQMVADFRETISTVGAKLNRIEETQAKILAILEAQENVGSSSGTDRDASRGK